MSIWHWIATADLQKLPLQDQQYPGSLSDFRYQTANDSTLNNNSDPSSRESIRSRALTSIYQTRVNSSCSRLTSTALKLHYSTKENSCAASLAGLGLRSKFVTRRCRRVGKSYETNCT